MKLPRLNIPAIIDAEDVGIIAKAAIWGALFVCAAATAGLAWTVFRLAGGL